MRLSIKLVFAILSFGFASVATDVYAQAKSEIAGLSRSEAVALVRTTFMRLNDANQTAKYEILRDLSAPAFQHRFKISDLNRLFAGFREKRIDLSNALTTDPDVKSAQYLPSQDLLKLTGQLATGAVLSRFQLTFQLSDGHWKLYGIALDFDRASPSETKRTSADRQTRLKEGVVLLAHIN